jgi:hypothetical protein
LESTRVALNVNAIFLLEKLGKVVSDALIEVFTSQMGITGSSEHFKHTVIDG